MSLSINQYDMNGNAIYQPSPLFMLTTEAADCLCCTVDSLRRARSKALHLKSHKYPFPIYLNGFGKVLYLRENVLRTAKARGLKNINIELEKYVLPPVLTLDELARLLCYASQTFRKNIKNTTLANEVIYPFTNKYQKAIPAEKVIPFIFPKEFYG